MHVAGGVARTALAGTRAGTTHPRYRRVAMIHILSVYSCRSPYDVSSLMCKSEEAALLSASICDSDRPAMCGDKATAIITTKVRVSKLLVFNAQPTCTVISRRYRSEIRHAWDATSVCRGLCSHISKGAVGTDLDQQEKQTAL